MPGIAGIIGSGQRVENLSALRSMVECMQHESFYSSGTYSNDRLRFSVGWACLKGSFSDCLPIWNENKDVLLILSGEDFTDRATIESAGVGGRHQNLENASYLVHLYEQMGPKFFEALNGRSSGLLADFREGKVMLFNDRYGLNRIYFHEGSDGFYFASEAKSLLKVLPSLRELDLRSLGELFSCGCVLENRTLFPGISLLPPASVWTFSRDGRLKKESYCNLETGEQQPPFSEKEYIERLHEIFPSVLARYFRNPGRLALSLTGGLDSRMILAHSCSPPRSLPCYSFGGMYRDCGDVRIAQQVAGICGQTHTTIRVDEKFLAEFPALAAKTVYVSDGTMDVTGAVELYVNRIAREIAPTRLTGSYGGEILRGLVAFKPASTCHGLLAPEFDRLVKTAAETYHHAIQGRKLSFIAFKQVPWHHYGRFSIEQSQLDVRSPYLDNDLVALAGRAPMIDHAKQELSRWLAYGANSRLGRIPTDRGVVSRPVPLVSALQRLWLDFTFKAEYAYDYGMPQWLTRLDQLLTPLRPERLFLGRHKFYHFRIWYRDQLAGYVKQVLLDPQALNRPWINRKRVEELVGGHVAGRLNATTQIHQLLTIELVHRQLLEAN
jgi:asparagine synthase (glutamine-hydrolysing)